MQTTTSSVIPKPILSSLASPDLTVRFAARKLVRRSLEFAQTAQREPDLNFIGRLVSRIKQTIGRTPDAKTSIALGATGVFVDVEAGSLGNTNLLPHSMLIATAVALNVPVIMQLCRSEARTQRPGQFERAFGNWYDAVEHWQKSVSAGPDPTDPITAQNAASDLLINASDPTNEQTLIDAIGPPGSCQTHIAAFVCAI